MITTYKAKIHTIAKNMDGLGMVFANLVRECNVNLVVSHLFWEYLE
jgi:hypothetical protein